MIGITIVIFSPLFMTGFVAA